MERVDTHLSGCALLKPLVREDVRGYFFESFRTDLFEQLMGHPFTVVQQNESSSKYGVVRGLHWQIPPRAQAKLIRVLSGEIRDVVVDLRPESRTFGQHYSCVLSAENKHQLFVPQGFAHGFSVLSPQAIVAYSCDALYAPAHERGLHPLDPDLGIDWGLKHEDCVLSAKDAQQPLWKEYQP
ncbi:MAG: dTDP-4-dehydrorhamnose 3,5-epimerase [Flavobacteriaceae bacterium]